MPDAHAAPPRRRWRRRLLCCLLWLHAPVLLLAVVPPPFTLMMAKAWVGGSPGIDYRWVSLADISPSMQLAVIAAEDQKFARHLGFDLEAIGAAWRHNQHGRRLRGGSTLSQQVAKNLFFPFGRNWVRKGVEAYWTCWIEALWSKRRILEVYLNVAELGPGIFGVEAASRHYFGRPARQLTAAEAARLAAVLPNPGAYSVGAPGPHVAGRAAWIRSQMRQLGPGWLQQVPAVPGWLAACFGNMTSGK